MTRNSAFLGMPRRRANAFALVEMVLALLIVASAISLAAVALPDSRRRAMASGSIQNLEQLGAGRSYAADFNDSVFSFTWRAGVVHHCGSYAFPAATNDNQAAADQAVCILRERAHRTDITQITSWVPHVSYATLPLLDYLNEELPSKLVVSPGDRQRLLWQQGATAVPGDPNSPVGGCGGSGNAEKRWPYSSSYELPPAWYSPDAMVNGIPTVSQADMHSTYYVGDSRTQLGRRTLSEVRFPSQKVMMCETNARFFGPRQPYFLYEEARVPVLLADGSVSIRSMNQANRGFNPSTPLNESPTRVNYAPFLCFESPTLNGAASQFVDGRVRWTRSGLLGRDFGGPEVPWSPP